MYIERDRFKPNELIFAYKFADLTRECSLAGRKLFDYAIIWERGGWRNSPIFRHIFTGLFYGFAIYDNYMEMWYGIENKTINARKCDIYNPHADVVKQFEEYGLQFLEMLKGELTFGPITEWKDEHGCSIEHNVRRCNCGEYAGYRIPDTHHNTIYYVCANCLASGGKYRSCRICNRDMGQYPDVTICDKCVSDVTICDKCVSDITKSIDIKELIEMIKEELKAKNESIADYI